MLLSGFIYPAPSPYLSPSRSEPDYQVYLNASKVPEFSDDLTELECRIVDMKSLQASVRFTVSWYYRVNRRSDDLVASELLAVMNGDWTLKYGDRSKQRAQDGDFIFSKERTDTFSFRIQRTTEEDRGSYYCAVSAWTKQRNDSWVKSKDVFSKPVNIFWASEGRRVSLVQERPVFSFGPGSSHCAFLRARPTCRLPCRQEAQRMQTRATTAFINSVNPFKRLMLEEAQSRGESWGWVGGRRSSRRCPQCGEAPPLTLALLGGLGCLGWVRVCEFLLDAGTFAVPQMKGQPWATAPAPEASVIHSERLFLGRGDKNLGEAILSALGRPTHQVLHCREPRLPRSPSCPRCYVPHAFRHTSVDWLPPPLYYTPPRTQTGPSQTPWDLLLPEAQLGTFLSLPT